MKLTLFGSSIQHSLSPKIYEEFARQFQIDLCYTKTVVTCSQDLKIALDTFRDSGGVGANITSPLKQEAYMLCDSVSQHALDIKAINVLVWKDHWYGTNTDGAGFIADLSRLKIDLKDLNILILGAGGAVRALLPLLLTKQPQNIFIANRTYTNILAFASDLTKVTPLALHALVKMDLKFDLIINAIPNFPENTFEALSKFIPKSCVYDLSYKENHPTPFLQWAAHLGAYLCADGIGMLVEQAALSFNEWFGVMPPITVKLELMKKYSFKKNQL
ncbi:MAG TPA: shikimate dehydrogenase [Gammaproteobacteria bacterium]|nr:shikimate dehydrogenase [Gammaproteobacteria bacterium]